MLLERQIDVLANRKGKRIRLLKNHADLPTQLDQVDFTAEQLLRLELNAPLNLAIGQQVGHSINRGQQTAFATSTGTDQARYLIRRNLKIDIAHCDLRTVTDGNLGEF